MTSRDGGGSGYPVVILIVMEELDACLCMVTTFKFEFIVCKNCSYSHDNRLVRTIDVMHHMFNIISTCCTIIIGLHSGHIDKGIQRSCMSKATSDFISISLPLYLLRFSRHYMHGDRGVT